MQWLGWGIKASFRDYLDGLDDVTTTIAEGAIEIGRVFWWPVTSEGDDDIRSIGLVRISAYGGMLEVELRDPALTISRSGGVLSVQAPGGSIEIAAGPVTMLDENITLTPLLRSTGLGMFGGTYSVGTELDPLMIRCEAARTS